MGVYSQVEVKTTPYCSGILHNYFVQGFLKNCPKFSYVLVRNPFFDNGEKRSENPIVKNKEDGAFSVG